MIMVFFKEIIVRRKICFFMGLSIFCVTNSGLGMEDDQFYKYSYNNPYSNEILVSFSGRVATIRAANLNITDDCLVSKRVHLRPLSVSQALSTIQYILSQHILWSFIQDIIYVDIDLRENTISDDGANMIVKYLCNHYKGDRMQLKSLNLSYNRMTNDGIGYLINNLKGILEQYNFENLDITGNYGANEANLNKIFSSLSLLPSAQGVIRGKVSI